MGAKRPADITSNRITMNESPVTLNGQRVAIFRALQLGDLLCTVPAWRALRAAHPGAHITLIGLPWARDFARRFARYINDFIEFPGAPGLRERPWDAAHLATFEEGMKEQRFDCLVQMHGSGNITNPLLSKWGARRLAGFHEAPSLTAPDRLMLQWDPRESEVRRYLRLAAALGADTRGVHLEFPLDDAERVAALELRGVRGPYVVIHPGARFPSRRWPVERYAAVADRLAHGGYAIIVTGTREEKALAAQLVANMRHAAIDLVGCTAVGVLAAVVAGARLVVCNDTGLSHVASAVRTPSVVVSSGSDALRWRPLDTSRHRVLWHDTPCRPCMHEVCPTGHECARAMTTEQVYEAAASLLAQTDCHAA